MRFGYREYRSNSIRVANVKEHALGNHSCHFSWRKIHDKQRLLALDLTRMGTLPFHSSKNRALVVAEVDFERDQLFRIDNFRYRENCADPQVNLGEKFE